tara:strand:- start:4645 stop:5334 length:690 start_codon:yes stop_codon:yes gene_type:complete
VDFEVVNTRHGFRLVQNGSVLSEVPGKPGPTHSVFDFLAASAVVLASGPRAALLGFAGGGMMAPLRALGSDLAICAVDLDHRGFDLFSAECKGWQGDLSFDRMDAATWLQDSDEFNVIIEDLSMPTEDDVEKPPVCWRELPEIMDSKLGNNGVIVTNILPSAGMSWKQMLKSFRGACRNSLLVHLNHFENKILIQTDQEFGARLVSNRLRKALRSIHSNQAREFRIERI